MTLRGLRVSIVCRGTAARARALSEAGATVVTMNVNDLAVGLDPALDVLLLEIGDAPEAFGVFMAGISLPLRVRPAIALVEGNVAARRLAPLGSIALLDDLAQDAALMECIESSLAASASSDAARLEDAEARAIALSDKLASTVRATQTLTHDVRVLCGVAMGYAANLRDGFAGPLGLAQQQHVAQILSAISDVGGLFERSADTLGSEAEGDDAPPPSIRRVVARRTSTDLVAIATSTVRLFAHVAADKGLDLTLSAPEPVRVWCDATQVKQAMTNLLVNALKFTGRGGQVTVSVGVAAGEGGGAIGVASRRNACITVRDSGPGVALADRERIFVRGVRSARHAHIDGSGIGLAVVGEVAVMHGGSVRVDHPSEGGAAFVLTLPIDRRRRRESSILLVDDVSAAARLVAALTEEGIEAFERVSGGERLWTLLAGCAAAVAVPRGRIAMLEEMGSEGADEPPVSSPRGPSSRRGGE